jgi:hypothetical protein
VSSDISSKLQNDGQFAAAFEEEANFCAGATQIHTHSPTCVKYSIIGKSKKGDLCRFKAPWKLVEKTKFTEDGVLQIRRNHTMVNRWNKAMAVGLRHNHDISFIVTQCKSMAIIYYVTNYTTKIEDPMWKRAAAMAESLQVLGDAEQQANVVENRTSNNIGQNRTRQFLMKVANRIFTERALSQVEVVANLLGYDMEFASNSAWTFLNVSFLYWHIFRQWSHLRCLSGTENLDDSMDETVLLEQAGERISFMHAYQYRGRLLLDVSLYDYMSIVKLKRIGKRGGVWGEVRFEDTCPFSKSWVQILREPGQHAVVCVDGYLSMDFNEDDNQHHKRYLKCFCESDKVKANLASEQPYNILLCLCRGSCSYPKHQEI